MQHELSIVVYINELYSNINNNWKKRVGGCFVWEHNALAYTKNEKTCTFIVHQLINIIPHHIDYEGSA